MSLATTVIRAGLYLALARKFGIKRMFIAMKQSRTRLNRPDTDGEFQKFDAQVTA